MIDRLMPSRLFQLRQGDLLQPFKNITTATQGRAATLQHVLSSMDFLLQRFEDAKTTAVEDNSAIMVTRIETS